MNFLIGYGYTENDNGNSFQEHFYEEELDRTLALERAYEYMEDFSLSSIFIVDNPDNAGEALAY